MFKCSKCGHLFESGEEKVIYETHGLPNPPYEERMVCPVCESTDYDEVSRCVKCGNFTNDTYHGICEDCLVQKIDYENGLNYMHESKNLAYFVFQYFYNMDYPKVTTKEFEEELRMIYLRRRVDDLATGTKTLLDMTVDFIKEDSLCDFADFLKERGDI